ncbi:MAG TPA: LptA/OstA family protein [Crenalkalicoccus sp.]|nr:LptA/OstA family protein [Crenalkalicoccus sp.]
MTRRAALPGLLLALLLALPRAAPAQEIDLSKGGPVDVTARDGIEWRQAEQVVIARGDARAVQQGVTVTADRLLARYRPVGGQAGGPAGGPPAGGQPAPAQPGQKVPGEAALGGGNNEIWRLEAEGHVTIATATDTAHGDRAVYDVDQAVLVMTGGDLSLTTPQQVITCRDSLEYWSARHMAVARGGALVVDSAENRRIAADTLVAYFLEAPPGQPAPPVQQARAGADSPNIPGQGRLDRVEAFGHVEIRTVTDVVRGDRGVYSAKTGLARLLGEVRITRGDNQVNGREAIVNLNTGVARLVSAPGARVQGLIVPQQQGQGGTDELLAPRPGTAR